MGEKLKIIIVDDHNMFRAGLKTLIGKSQKAEIIAEAVNGRDFLNLLEHDVTPDVVLMDIAMPILDGIEATHKALRMNPNLKIIALSMFGEEEYYFRMIEAGVKGFVIKSSGIHEIEQAIKEVAAGKNFFSDVLLFGIFNNINLTKQKMESSGLTEVEFKILVFICRNLSDQTIAGEMEMSTDEISALRQTVMSKTNSNSPSALALYAIKNKIISL
jgi:DNA-binding NarL/FixJ family response regulator